MYVTNFCASEGGMLPCFLKKLSYVTLNNAMSLSRFEYNIQI